MALTREPGRPESATEEGAALAIALIFILVVGILVTAALSKSGGVMKTNYLVREQAQLQYAADAGIDRAIQVLRDDVSTHPRAHFCFDSSSGVSHMTSDATSADFNGMAFNTNITDANTPHSPLKVWYSCNTRAGSAPDWSQQSAINYAVVTTGGNKDGGASDTLTSSNGSGVTLQVDGPIYVPGPEKLGDFSKNITIKNGDLVEYYAGDLQACQQSLNNIVVSSGNKGITIGTASNQSTCSLGQTPIFAIPTTNLDADAPGAAPHYVQYPSPAAETCRVFFPGTYTSPPALLVPSHNVGENYFVSGRYYFEDIGNWNPKNGEVVIGGQPAPGDQTDSDSAPASGASGCEHFANADPAVVRTIVTTLITASGVTLAADAPEWDTGTQFIFGGRSSINPQKVSISLYTPPTANGPASLMAVRTDQWTPTGTTDTGHHYKAWHATSQSQVVSIQGSGNNVGFEVNGALLAPDAPVQLAGTVGTTAVVRGGLFASTADISAAAAVSPGNYFFQAAGGGTGPFTPPQRRTITITACVDPANPSTDCTSVATPTATTFTETALVTIDNLGTRPAKVFTWRAT